MCEYGSLNLRLWFLQVIFSFLLIRHSKIQCRIPVAKFCRCTAWHFQIKIFVLLLLTWHQAIFYATSTLFSVLNFSKGKPKWKNFFFSFFFSHSFAKEANFYFKCHHPNNKKSHYWFAESFRIFAFLVIKEVGVVEFQTL